MQNNWIEWKWTPENPYPETLETMVDIRWVNGGEIDSPAPVKYWEWDIQGNDTDITHYRIAED